MLTQNFVIPFLKMTSWRMIPPRMFGPEHICALIGVVILALASVFAVRNMGEKDKVRLLAALGWIMLIMEAYKQLFYYYIVNGGSYDWWFFPFQLCSVPMYMCILLPLVSDKIRDVLLTFMAGFTFVSALAALIYPQDMMRPYAALTAHGFIWHGILLFISLLIGLTGMGNLSWKGFLRSVWLFLGLCAAATMINVIAEPIAAASSAGTSYPNMFYLSPFHMSYQPIVIGLESVFGILTARIAYILVIILAAGFTDLRFAALQKVMKRFGNNKKSGTDWPPEK